MKTYSVKPKDITRDWYILDAKEAPLGRLSTKAAELLVGKHKPRISPHMDCGDYVIVLNSEAFIATGKKASDKLYWRHSGFPGGIKKRRMSEVAAQSPNRVIEHAIRGMLPINKLREARLARLKIYPGAEHSHQAQKPQIVTLDNKKDK